MPGVFAKEFAKPVSEVMKSLVVTVYSTSIFEVGLAGFEPTTS
jgi:hypothetical protein